MTTPVTFAPSLSLTRKFLAGESLVCGKEWARCLVQGDLFLSVPVQGGASCLKGRHVDVGSLLISDHGKWRQEHLGTWNAIYGKTPFFDHLFPEIKQVYTSYSNGTLGAFNSKLFELAMRFLDMRNLATDINEMQNSRPELIKQLRVEYETKVNLNYSIFDALFRLGRNTIWVLI